MNKLGTAVLALGIVNGVFVAFFLMCDAFKPLHFVNVGAYVLCAIAYYSPMVKE